MEHKELWQEVGDVDESAGPMTIGQAAVRRTGQDVSLITWSSSTHACLKAAEELQEHGIDAEVIDLRTLWPWDRETVFASVRKTGRVVVVNESNRVGGFGGELLAEIAEHCFGQLQSPPLRLGSPRIPVPYSKPLEDLCRVGSAHIASTVRDLMAGSADKRLPVR
jgi:pyruvate/2-oxoglutarate/acetoin dehydrogenase E1 component